MATNLALNDALIQEAKQLGKHPSKKAAVTAALEEYVQRRKQLRILDLVGKIEYFPDYDIRKVRKSKVR